MDQEDPQQPTNDLIEDFQSESITPNDNNLLPRKSITSGRFLDNQENTSTPAIVDSASENPPEGPVRSMSESALIDHHDSEEPPPTLPIQEDARSTDAEEVFVKNQDGLLDESQQPITSTKQHDLDEHTRSSPSPRAESASHKRPVGLLFHKTSYSELSSRHRHPSRKNQRRSLILIVKIKKWPILLDDHHVVNRH